MSFKMPMREGWYMQAQMLEKLLCMTCTKPEAAFSMTTLIRVLATGHSLSVDQTTET